jgi:hypothetical protein
MPPIINPFGELQLFQSYHERFLIPTSEVKTLYSVPKTIIPAIPGKLSLPKYLTIHKPAGTVYTANGNTSILLLHYDQNSSPYTSANISVGSLLQAAESWYALVFNEQGGSWASFYNTAGSTFFNTPWKLKLDTADMTVGDGHLEVGLIYYTVPLSIF